MLFIPNNRNDYYGHLLNALRARYHAWTRRGQPGNDIDMYGILQAMNRLDGVSTVFCCESHPKRNQPARFYIMCAANPIGVEKLGMVVDSCHRRMSGIGFENLSETVKLVHTRAIIPTGDRRTGMWLSYPAYVIECEKVTRKGKREFLWQFLQAVEEVGS